MAGTDLRVLSVVPATSGQGVALDAIDVTLANRSAAPVTVVSATLGIRTARAGLPLLLEPAARAGLRIPRPSCRAPVVPEGNLVLGLRLADGSLEAVTLRAGRDFLAPGPSTYAGCPPSSLRGVVETSVLYARQPTPRTVQLRLLFRRGDAGARARPRLDGVRSTQSGLVVRMVEGWPARIEDGLGSYATVELSAPTCRGLHVPDTTLEPVLRLAGSVREQRDLASPERDVEVVPLVEPDITLAVVRLLAGACPELLPD